MPSTTEVIGKLSDSDRAMMMNARAEVQKADAVWQFVAKHIGATYALDGSIDVTANGDIVRQLPASDSSTATTDELESVPPQ